MLTKENAIWLTYSGALNVKLRFKGAVESLLSLRSQQVQRYFGVEKEKKTELKRNVGVNFWP